MDCEINGDGDDDDDVVVVNVNDDDIDDDFDDDDAVRVLYFGSNARLSNLIWFHN